ncbi:hypothetical protein G6F50_013471 [Rhizopus delemar]|uniref:Uncharacterized protein n=1 Tax=Rhizopus delemar TaxID=936053 RepID=A0A9P6YI52_9FUNG|nr:hypothetical protein G6F50_013471 [Rhizopus delemar]
MLAVNLAFGVLARAAPALNPIQLGLPVSLLLGLFLLALLAGEMGPPVQRLFDAAFQAADASECVVSRGAATIGQRSAPARLMHAPPWFPSTGRSGRLTNAGRHVQPVAGGDLGAGGRDGLVHRAGDGRAHGHCTRQGRGLVVAAGRRLRHGPGHLVDALHRHAGLQPAHSARIRPADHPAFAGTGHRFVGVRAVAGFAAHPAASAAGRWCAADGHRHCWHALRWHGRHAHAPGHRIRPRLAAVLVDGGGRRLVDRAVCGVPPARAAHAGG